MLDMCSCRPAAKLMTLSESSEERRISPRTGRKALT